MKLVYTGKTKNVHDIGGGLLRLALKDDATGKDGVFDPGENSVGLTIAGLGRESLRLSAHFFAMLSQNGIRTHYVGHDIERAHMDARAAQVFGNGLEFVCRLVADGSFVRRYGQYAKFGRKLDALVEATLKDDAAGDPPITPESLAELGIMSESEYAECSGLTKKAARLIEAALAEKGLALHDIKFEFGKADGEIIMIDEISAGCMRVYKDGKPVGPMELSGLALGAD